MECEECILNSSQCIQTRLHISRHIHMHARTHAQTGANTTTATATALATAPTIAATATTATAAAAIAVSAAGHAPPTHQVLVGKTGARLEKLPNPIGVTGP